MSWSVLGYCWSFIVIVRRDPCRWRGYSTCPERNTAALKYRKLNAVAPEWPPKLANRLWIPGCALTKPLVACSQIRFLLFLSIIQPVFFPFQFASVWGPWLFPPWESSLWGGPGVIWVSRLEEWPHSSGHLSLGRWVVWKREGSLPSRRGVG